MLERITNQSLSTALSCVRSMVNKINTTYNALPVKLKKITLLSFGIVTGGISLLLIIQALGNQENRKELSIESIRTPKDIYMKHHNQDVTEDRLIPVGKLKGEINGEFEAFYLAVDAQGKTYINRSVDFSKDAYHKSKGWEEISRDDLAKYEKALHFLPARGKGIKH